MRERGRSISGEREWLTTGQAARLCSVKPDTVLKWIKRGKLTARRTPGGHHRIKRGELRPLVLSPPGQTLVEDRKPGRPLRCWEYLSGGGVPPECRSCIVYRSRAAWCFRMVGNAAELGHALRHCRGSCEDCAYFRRVEGLSSNVLVVSRDEALRNALTAEACGAVGLRFARDGYEASAAIRDFRPSFVVIDASLLRQGESQLLVRLAADPRAAGIRVILAVDRGEVRRAGAGLDSGIVVGLLEKPFGPGCIVSVIDAFPVEGRAPAGDPLEAAEGAEPNARASRA